MERTHHRYCKEEPEEPGATPQQTHAPSSRAARFHRERAAEHACQQTKKRIYAENLWHVAMVGNFHRLGGVSPRNVICDWAEGVPEFDVVYRYDQANGAMHR